MFIRNLPWCFTGTGFNLVVSANGRLPHDALLLRGYAHHGYDYLQDFLVHPFLNRQNS